VEEQNNFSKVTQPLISQIIAERDISQDDVALIEGYFKHERFGKNRLLEREKSVARKLYFILKGFIRVYYEDNLVEITTQLFAKHQLVTSFESFVNSTRSTENVKAITDCEVLSISKVNYLKLYDESAAWRNFCKRTYEKIIKHQQERTRKLLAMSAEERYNDLIVNFPELVQFVPVQFLSSFLGMKPESLSRIRRKVIS
jgi:CRP/FNR family transcriptional regulator, anaerobic regulatory protein